MVDLEDAAVNSRVAWNLRLEEGPIESEQRLLEHPNDPNSGQELGFRILLPRSVPIFVRDLGRPSHPLSVQSPRQNAATSLHGAGNRWPT